MSTVQDLANYLDAYVNSAAMSLLEKAAFMARMNHETGGFQWMVELGGSSYFEQYDNRADLGNNQPGDGYLFRGRGFIMLTGRYNYTKYAPLSGADILNNPDLAANADVAARIAILFWNNTFVGGQSISTWARNGNIDNVVLGVNGGTNGMQQTIDLYNQYKKIYGV